MSNTYSSLINLIKNQYLWFQVNKSITQLSDTPWISIFFSLSIKCDWSTLYLSFIPFSFDFVYDKIEIFFCVFVMLSLKNFRYMYCSMTIRFFSSVIFYRGSFFNICCLFRFMVHFVKFFYIFYFELIFLVNWLIIFLLFHYLMKILTFLNLCMFLLIL